MCNAMYSYYVPKITDACQRRYFIHWKFLSTLYDDHSWCIINDLPYSAINNVEQFGTLFMRIASMCPLSFSACVNYVVTILGGSTIETVFIVSATCTMQIHPLGQEPILSAYNILSNYHFM